jgi:predicted GNAT superfamily acetyltransferase
MPDTLNSGGGDSDRILMAWQLDDPRVVALTEGHQPAEATVIRESAVTVLQVGPDEQPLTSPARSATLLCYVPLDIDAIRSQDSGLASKWRLALREVLYEAMQTGYSVDGFLRTGCYVLRRSG